MKTLRRFHTLSWLAIVALILGLTAALGVSQAAAGQAAGKTLIIALDQSDMKTLDVSRQFEFAAAFICLNTYDSLLMPKSPADLNTYVPALATSWSVSNDGKEYTAEREVRERESLHCGGHQIHLHPAQKPEGKCELADGPPQGGPGRRPVHREDDHE
jgi:hypothetical protein